MIEQLSKWMAVLLFLFTLVLSGCALNAPEKMMAPVKYTPTVNLHINKTARLYWGQGAVFGTLAPSQSTVANSGSVTADVIGAIVSSTIQGEQRAKNPDKFTFKYGKGSQSVFMTSLRNIMQQNSIFTSISLETEPQKMGPEDVDIQVNFINTRVGKPSENYPVYLSIELAIKDKQGRFKRRYDVASSLPKNAFNPPLFTEQETDASKRLMAKLFDGLKAWQSSRK